jgi:glutathione peroxidase
MAAALISLVLLGCHTPAMPLKPAASEHTIYDFKMKNIDGQDVSLRKYRGKVILVVNVASKCGFTPQYAGLEKLYEEKKGQGLVILGFPANNFGSQEPGTDSEIKEFCSSKYMVTFPMFSKISVKGDDEHPLYKWLIANSDRQNDIEWNFTKFVIARDGTVFKRFVSKDSPDSPQLLQALDEALAAK